MLIKGAILIVVLSTCIYYIKHQYSTSTGDFTSENKHKSNSSSHEDIDAVKVQLLSKEEVAEYVTEEKLYLCILGHVFDVTKGKGYYKKGETYHGFVGRDGTRAFVSGNFTDEGFTDDIDNITGAEAVELNNWLDFYQTNYVFKGKLIGRFFDPNGTPTKYWHEFQTKLKQAEEGSEEMLQEKMKYPPCNIAWSQEEGTRVWCSTKSGGIERDWAGVPRKFYQVGAESYRCACVNLDTKGVTLDTSGRQGNLAQYDNCDPRASSCYVVNEED
uniref:Neuferricin n=1 Tax=Cacopsylla melanoneura TaxID=428564 RepID=A0A8D8WFX7_9HEMI